MFDLFIVTLFWAFTTDLSDSKQAKRLFAFIAVGGQLWAIAGPLFTASFVQRIGTPALLLIAAAGLELAPSCVKFFPAPAPVPNPNPIPREKDYEQEKEAERPIGGSIITAFTHVMRSPYLLGICRFMVLYAVTSTFVYFQQADITRPAREVLFTVLRREDKYKAKSFIDTFVYRTGDQIGAWSYTFLTWIGLGLTGISYVAAPLAALWCGLSIWLGRKQSAMALAQTKPAL